MNGTRVAKFSESNLLSLLKNVNQKPVLNMVKKIILLTEPMWNSFFFLPEILQVKPLKALLCSWMWNGRGQAFIMWRRVMVPSVIFFFFLLSTLIIPFCAHLCFSWDQVVTPLWRYPLVCAGLVWKLGVWLTGRRHLDVLVAEETIFGYEGTKWGLWGRGQHLISFNLI